MIVKMRGRLARLGLYCLAGLLPAAILVTRPLPVQGQTQTPPAPRAFSLYWENDLFTGTDRDYTNGLKLTYSRPYIGRDAPRADSRGWADGIMDALSLLNAPASQKTVSYSLGQNIYTPKDTQRRELVRDDRPYAGYTYFGVGLHARQGMRRRVLELDLGVVGPLSMAESLQDVAHDVSDSTRARGWDNQLDNEPTLEIIWETKWRLWHKQLPAGWSADFIPHLGARAGNVAIYANTGAEMRLGWYLPDNFGSCPIRPGCDLAGAADYGDPPTTSRLPPFGLHLFAGVDGRLVLRDIFLDGNTFSESHSVDKEPLVADLMIGIVMRYRRLSLSYAYVFRTREFKQQEQTHAYGAINLVYTF